MRAPLPRAADYTKSFIKDWERLSRSGRYDLNRLKKAMLLLIANDGSLGAEWLDYPLKGHWEGRRECHIGGDCLTTSLKVKAQFQRGRSYTRVS